MWRNLSRYLLAVSSFALCGCVWPHQHPEDPRGAWYREQTEAEYIIVEWFPDEDCKLQLLRGPNSSDLNLEVAHCNAEELAEGKALLTDEMWDSYVAVNESPRPARWIMVTRDFPVIRGYQGTKQFSPESMGPERELIEYFRGLFEKYRRN